MKLSCWKNAAVKAESGREVKFIVLILLGDHERVESFSPVKGLLHEENLLKLSSDI